MSDDPAAPLLALARAALEDDKRATPGPWHVPHLDRAPCRVLSDVGATIADVPRYGWGANAPFIAAARTREPALARALVEMLENPLSCPRLFAPDGTFVVAYRGHGATEMRALAAALWRAAATKDGELPPLQTCRRFDAWGCDEDEIGARVDPLSCRVCGGYAHQHGAGR